MLWESRLCRHSVLCFYAFKPLPSADFILINFLVIKVHLITKQAPSYLASPSSFVLLLKSFLFPFSPRPSPSLHPPQIYLLAPKSALGSFIKKPFIKFICHTASYLTFLFLLLLASQHIARTNLHMQGPPPTIVEWMILPWVLGKFSEYSSEDCA